jgi:hypothetical protein
MSSFFGLRHVFITAALAVFVNCLQLPAAWAILVGNGGGPASRAVTTSPPLPMTPMSALFG